MRTCIIKSVYEAIVRLRGYDPLTADLTAAQKAVIAELINERVIEGQEDAFWPEVMLIQQRQYRPTWNDEDNYAEDDEVYHVDADGDGHYYISLQNGNVDKDPATETTWWAEVGDSFLRTISFTQDGETEIGAVDLQDCIFNRDPRVNPGTKPLSNIRLYDDNVLVASDEAPLRPWLKFRPVTPQFSLTDWDATVNYAVADLVYLETYGEGEDEVTVGQTFKALQSSTNKNPYSETAHWEPVDFPFFLKPFVKHAVKADQTMEDEGRFKEESKAQSELDLLHERLIDQRGDMDMRKATFTVAR